MVSLLLPSLADSTRLARGILSLRSLLSLLSPNHIFSSQGIKYNQTFNCIVLHCMSGMVLGVISCFSYYRAFFLEALGIFGSLIFALIRSAPTLEIPRYLPIGMSEPLVAGKTARLCSLSEIYRKMSKERRFSQF